MNTPSTQSDKTSRKDRIPGPLSSSGGQGLIFGSVCSGIEAASVAWHPLGWKAAWYSEIEKFPSAVLQRHYPDIPNLGDMTKIHESEVFNGTNIDVLVGGTPCQSFSIAGLRKGLDDPRGNLALVFLALLDRKRPQWVVWENVPGVLSSWSDETGSFKDEESGRERGWQSNDFDTFTSGLAQLGYGVAWRVLDAQHFGVPQRRQRVFVVGYLGDWRPAAAVLFESHGLSGHSAPRREAGKGSSRDVGRSLKASGGFKGAEDHETLIAHTLRGEGFDASEDGTGRGTPIVFTEQSVNQEACPTLLGHDHGRNAMNHPCIAFGSKDNGADASEDLAPTLRAGTHDGSHANAGVPPAVCYDMRGNGDGDNVPTLTGHHAGAISDFSPVVFTQGNLARGIGRRPSDEVAPTFQSNAGDQHPCVFTQNSRSEVREMGDRTGAVTSEPGAQCQNYLKTGMAVRRLTPVECSRLQGFPDDYLEINYADAVQAHAVQILHELWRTASAFAREGWRPGIIASLLTPEILLAGVYVGWISWAMVAKCATARRTLSGAEPWPEGFVRTLQVNAEHRSSPYRRESFEQCARELGGPLSELSLERAQAEAALRDCELWPIAQKKWPLRYAFAKKKAGENGLNPDGPRYKAIGNSMAVPVMRWIGERIQAVEAML